jgi:biotin/methionine sulfoxide reductase
MQGRGQPTEGAKLVAMKQFKTHSSHWGAFLGRSIGDELEVIPHPQDPDPSPLLGNLPSALRHRSRIARPMVRRGWLESGPGADERRGRDEFIALDWDDAADLVAAELTRVKDRYGSQAIYGGSYGWSSAGRFHHAQSQLHRFLNCFGGYTRSVNTYSAGSANVIIPRVLASFDEISRNTAMWPEIARATDLVVCFGGMALKNTMISAGGVSRHLVRSYLQDAFARGTDFILISPVRDDLPIDARVTWRPIVPGTDTALMLGLAHTLISRSLHDIAFIDRYCDGFGQLHSYIFGRTDGQAKDASWAAEICGIEATAIVRLAELMAKKRTLITVSQSLQRAEHGEQPVWMGIALAALLGQIGLEGGGFNYGIGSMGNIGKLKIAVPLPTLPQGKNRVADFIPCARVADMLLKPGEPYDYNGDRLIYPHIRLVYWAGGNPFHHHQDLNRLRKAFGRAETIIFHESFWTGSAKHADIVLPSTMTEEREDIGASSNDPLIVAMHQLIAPYGEAKDDYDAMTMISERLGTAHTYTEGRTARQWLAVLYEGTRVEILSRGGSAPSFEEFWDIGELRLPTETYAGGLLRSFRDNPDKVRLPTPSGKIELYSKTIDSFGYDDCPGHPAWIPPIDGLPRPDAEHPIQLISNQPKHRLHSQLDFGECSQAGKVNGREPVRINPKDAEARSIAGGDVVRLYNARGSCLAAAWVTEDVMPGVAQLSTGAWYDPLGDGDKPICIHGNPNVLTRDTGTSKLSQGCSGHLTRIEIERYAYPPPPVRAFEPAAVIGLSEEKLAHYLASRTKRSGIAALVSSDTAI